MNKIFEMVQKESGDMKEWGIRISCPYCKGVNTHFEGVSERTSDDYTAWDGRGDAARIAMYCEQCPNLFYLRVGEHKGESYLGVETSFIQAKMHTVV